jgi:hypothetical protein
MPGKPLRDSPRASGLVLEAANFQDLHAERLEPGQQPVQCRLILERAVHDGLDLVHGCVQPVEVEQSLGGEDSRYADLVVHGRHRRPPKVLWNATVNSPCPGQAVGAPLRTGDTEASPGAGPGITLGDIGTG